MMIRIGHGYDVHRFSQTPKPLILAGIKVDEEMGVDAHSDGDVIIHALCDALLGAAALRDIGYHFPDTDEKHKGQSSHVFLETVMKLLVEKNYHINNIDITVVAQKPKLKNFISDMIESLAGIIRIKNDQINIKATTTEKLGFVGRVEGISAYAVCLIQN
ncbi:2-C-methyl-D-erythritol 2,4-cyclodiphosphate synthase [Thiotrichales bacterium 19S11-10]|nr:2-C-methyl-D-erythritol 2,4-cyclodiphosphate synthase [Thiotrichales bacterium 19S11-10]MCF6807107.1 2-C-methyl-D-erythritol 2,4-cyclodiphosphate synthase [Thiotrichales bacterium 19S9-11]MCF6811076.1 2-C-methyl-D-erythritol 2,4-cyclodiphosphate synthase [Thiotrichales bacterium 19S9-12]